MKKEILLIVFFLMATSVPFVVSAVNYSNKIDDWALSPYTAEKGYPKLVAKFGSRMDEITKYRRKAAHMAIDSGKCDHVTISALSTKSKLSSLLFWVDCKNGQRIYLNEREIRAQSAVLTQADKSWERPAAIKACIKSIKTRAMIPSTLNIHSVLGTTYYKAPTTQNVVVKMDFDAKNSLGVKHNYQAICNFSPGKIGEIVVKPR